MYIRQKSSEAIKNHAQFVLELKMSPRGLQTVEMQNFPAKYRLQRIIQTKLGEFQKNAHGVKRKRILRLLKYALQPSILSVRRMILHEIIDDVKFKTNHL